jgi:MoxR-like ATPase
MAKAGLQDRFVAFAAMLKGQFRERDGVIEGMICAALAGEHVLLLGPPGTAKSALSRAFSGGVSDVAYFEWLLSKFSAPEELFGPMSLKALKEDRYERVTMGKLPEAHVAFLDEIFKSNSGVLNSLLTAINERKFHNGAGARDIPLRMVVGASNELPEGPELAALYDRFLLRFWVDYLQAPDAFMGVLIADEPTLAPQISLTQWDAARAQVAQVALPLDVAQTIYKLRTELGVAGVKPSDRRWKRCVRLLKANAWMTGEAAVSEDHFGVLTDALWDLPEQRAAVAEAVAKHVSSIVGEATKVVDLLLSQISALPPAPAQVDESWQNRLTALNREGGRAVQTLEGLASRARNERQKQAVKRSIETVKSRMAPVRQMAREALGL